MKGEAPGTRVEKDGCEREAEEKTQCRSTQVKHPKTALDQTICIELSLGLCDSSSVREVGGGIWPRKRLAKLTYSYLL